MNGEAWPALDIPGWPETSETMHLWLQIIGKTQLELRPPINHWWHVPLYVTARGLGTSPMRAGTGVFDVEMDLVAHRLVLRGSDGTEATIPLESGTLAGFYARYTDELRRLGVTVEPSPFSVEMPERVNLRRDTRPRAYDPGWANRVFRALLQADQLLKQFRGGFIGKASPVHVFWGAFDLAVTRFSGRTAPPHPGGAPHVADRVMREAYSHEVSSAGFWPGDARYPEAAFYSYAYPEPAGFRDVAILPEAAHYDPALGEYVLPYRAVRESAHPDADVLAFLNGSYAAAAELASWDRRALERAPEATSSGEAPGQISGENAAHPA